MTALIILVIVLLLLIALGVGVMSIYNGFVRRRNMIQEAWRQVDVELNRRYELIPNLVETVRGFAAHERNTLEDVTRLRNQAASVAHQEGALPSEQRARTEEALSGAVHNLLVSVEAYPDLKSNQNFLHLQKELSETEDRIAAGRRYYNANVRDYNTKVESVPSSLIASAFKFDKATYFEVNDPVVRQSPDVNFGSIAYRDDERQAPPQQAPSQPAPQQPQLDQQPTTPTYGAQTEQPYGQQALYGQQAPYGEQAPYGQQPQGQQQPPQSEGYQPPGEWRQS